MFVTKASRVLPTFVCSTPRLNVGHRLRRTLTTVTSSPKEEKAEPIITASNDAEYFKRLGKTVNHYWTDNVESVLGRLDMKKLVDPGMDAAVKENLRRRYCDDKVDLQSIRSLWRSWQDCPVGSQERLEVSKKLVSLALWVPNETAPQAMAIGDDTPLVLKVFGEPLPQQNKVLEFHQFCDKFNLLKDDNLGNIAFSRSYFLKGPLAELETALVLWALNFVKKAGFQLISVPDIVYPHIIESCGMKTRAERDQIFWVELPDAPQSEVCLSGTAEMAIAGSLKDRVLSKKDLPLKLAAVSRCFRAETSSIEEERGLYRVHEFTKVELFGVTAAETLKESAELHEEIKTMQEQLFSELGIHFKTLEMPPSELGLPAVRKFDIEAWMPGRKFFGEISSCSNCTDFQSRRLNIQYEGNNGRRQFAHTVNGTALAVPRMLITLVESCQQEDGTLKLPNALQKYMNRSWEDSLKSYVPVKSIFMRTKGSQLKYTKAFRNLEFVN